ncbi:hypothetical protein POL68_41260 [Stigmatella sp. ncwal1]|uniref:Lipoprotein n=1 Tax=Stigmatella ashevillensis TaxID=2995309 RepID=A0ABT5DP62_9BACT|nr:hypothetical protein [Stigmatella ashevillena]MDC0714950.1 hypothetical protein [Stigmatella ashevillena]
MSTHRVLLPALLATLGCNTFIQNPGLYELEPVEVLRDDCSLLSPGMDFWDGSLLISGQVVRMVDFELLNMQLIGRFLAGGETFTVDGSVANAKVIVNGQECLLDQVSVHIDAATVCESEFKGTLRVRYEARRPDSCVCELWAKFNAVQDSLTCAANP